MTLWVATLELSIGFSGCCELGRCLEFVLGIAVERAMVGLDLEITTWDALPRTRFSGWAVL